MITKYNMTTGELTYQSKQKCSGASRPKPHEIADLVASLQLLEIEVKPESKSQPADLLSIPVSDFLRDQK
jgi:hypothetical protein